MSGNQSDRQCHTGRSTLAGSDPTGLWLYQTGCEPGHLVWKSLMSRVDDRPSPVLPGVSGAVPRAPGSLSRPQGELARLVARVINTSARTGPGCVERRLPATEPGPPRPDPFPLVATWWPA